MSDCIFEIQLLWQSGLIGCILIATVAVHLNSEIIQICQSSHTMFNNNIVNFQASTIILNAYTKSLESYRMHLVYLSSYWHQTLWNLRIGAAIVNAKCGALIFPILNVVLWLTRYSIFALVPWLPHGFPGSLFISSFVLTLPLKDPQLKNNSISPAISNDGRGGSLEQVVWVLATQRQEKLSVNN